jgi:hypothetical protein
LLQVGRRYVFGVTPAIFAFTHRSFAFGQPLSGFFLEISFRIASFQSPSILRTSGSGPGGLRGFLIVFVFGFFAAVKMASPVSESAEVSPMVRDNVTACLPHP